MDASSNLDATVARIAAAIGDPARARMLYCLLDNRARTSTELALVAGIAPATASAHLTRLRTEGLVRLMPQGRHRFYSLSGHDVAALLEKLSILAGASRTPFVASTPDALRNARTCYDHIAGTLGVQLHDAFLKLEWLVPGSAAHAYAVTAKGESGFRALGVDIDTARILRRQFANPCLDWSERRSHLGGALGAAVLALATSEKWVIPEREGRALRVTAKGERALQKFL